MKKTKTIELIDFSEINPYNDKGLRDYQMNYKEKIYSLWSVKRSLMLQMPTGTGKTRLFVSIVNDLVNWGRKAGRDVHILILAHRKELIEQISKNVGITYRLPHGLIVANNAEQKDYPIQVGSVPTLNRRIERWANYDFDIVIVDEAHHVLAESYKKILKEYPTAKVLGVTATPYRLNHASFRPEFDEIIISQPVSQFIRQGYLCDYDYYSIKPDSIIQQEISNIRKFALDGDYLDEAMLDIMDTDYVRANILKTYLKYANGKKGIIYTINRRHNTHICERFRSIGLKAVAIDSNTPTEERNKYVESFRKGEIDIICNVNIFSEGFDCPDVEFIQLARPTKSLSMYLQQVGRGLRTAPGKDKVIILDNVGMYNRFGFPSARRHWRHHFEGRDIEDISCFSGEGIGDRTITLFDNFEEGDEEAILLHSSKQEDIDISNEFLEMQKKIREKEEDQMLQNYKEKLVAINSTFDILSSQNISIPQELISQKKQIEKEISKINIKRKIENGLSEYFNVNGRYRYHVIYNEEDGVKIAKI